MRRIWIITILCIAFGLISLEAMAYSSASETSYALASSNLCIQAFTGAERRHGIPKHLLMAIANTESGRYNPQIKRVVPWPWTLNVHGKGFYYDTMHDAVTAIRRAKQRGQNSIDVGCMQISLKHHPDAFGSELDALSPDRNVDYAAKFLRQNFDDLGSWPQAIAAYHSRTPSRGTPYYAIVRKRWQDVRGNAGGNMLENSDYMVAGVKVTRLPVRAKPPVNSEFDIAMTDDMSSQPKVFTGDVAEPRVIKVGQQSAGTMKVITVAAREVRTRDAAIVTITPASQRTLSYASVPPKDISNVPSTHQSSASRSKGPNWIFGYE